MQNQDQSANIEHVSDTAIWIAAYRAQETERPDAAFKDHLAAKLAGSRGKEMIASTPHSDAMAFAMVVRTVAIDKLVLSAISKGVKKVINLGTGLDTRPYRLNLPSELKWIEVDFPDLITYKNEKLANEKALCELQRIGVDLSNDAARRKLFEDLNDSQPALIITEGVIGYLTNKLATELAKDLFNTSSFQYWIMDYAQGKMRKTRQTKDLDKKIKQTPLLFDCDYPLQFFEQTGWKVCEDLHILDEADKIGKKFPLMFPWSLLMKLFPKKFRALGNNTYGYVMFSK